MRLRVLKIYPNGRDAICKSDAGTDHIVDMTTDGTLPEGTMPGDLVGRTVEVDYLYPYIEFAAAPRLVPAEALAPANSNAAG